MKSNKPSSIFALEPSDTADAVREQAIAWLLLMRKPAVPQAERDALNVWLAANPSHRQMYETVEAQWQWLEPFAHMPFPAREQALRYRRKPHTPWIAYSTAAMLLLALGLTAFSPAGWLGMMQTYSAGKGQRQTLTLADGSRMELNTDSEVRVQFNYWQRNVELVKGEAFFTVQHDAERPFEVVAGNGRIRDIGTAFEVYKKNAQVIVAVQEGIVEVQTTEKRQVTAGQQLSFNDKGQFQTVQDLNVSDLTAWRDGYVVFRNRSLNDVLGELARYHNIRIRLQNPSIGELKVSGTFHTDKLNDMLKAVTVILPVKVDYLGQREVLLKSTMSH